MTVFAAIRGLTFLARDVFEAALYLIPAPGLSGYDVDGADALAEREAAVDVSEPQEDCGLVGEFVFGTNQYMPLPDEYDDEDCLGCGEYVLNCVCPPRPPRTRPSGCGPRCGSVSPDGTLCHRDSGHPGDHTQYFDASALTGAIQSEKLIAPLTADEVIAVRELLAERAHNAPVASASPPTPADATGPQDDPASVHRHTIRRMWDEDRRNNNKGDI